LIERWARYRIRSACILPVGLSAAQEERVLLKECEFMGASRIAVAGLLAIFLSGGVSSETLAAERTAPSEKKIAEALARLSKADRSAATAQRYCAIASDSRLGSMGTPLRLSVDGKTVFVCCKGCVKRAQANPKATLASVKKLEKIAAAMAKLSSEDRMLAEAQRYCAVESENRLGTMGAPVKVTVGGEAVFLCCAGCIDAVQADPKGTLATAKRLKEAD
jgi:hypothetical protein